MLETLLIALASGAVCGLVAWGGMRVELRWLRSDVNKLDKRVNRVEDELIERGARTLADNLSGNPGEHRP